MIYNGIYGSIYENWNYTEDNEDFPQPQISTETITIDKWFPYLPVRLQRKYKTIPYGEFKGIHTA